MVIKSQLNLGYGRKLIWQKEANFFAGLMNYIWTQKFQATWELQK